MGRKPFTSEERERAFWSKVERGAADECWLWQGATNGAGKGLGHGQITVVGARVLAHRYSWELAHGSLPEGMFVLHRCDNPPCINPAHPVPGDAEGQRDRHAH